jgi:hypothetical protein
VRLLEELRHHGDKWAPAPAELLDADKVRIAALLPMKSFEFSALSFFSSHVG